MRTSALLSEKNLEFFEIYYVSARTMGGRGLGQCGQGRGVNFSRFRAYVLYGRPLISLLLRYHRLTPSTPNTNCFLILFNYTNYYLFQCYFQCRRSWGCNRPAAYPRKFFGQKWLRFGQIWFYR